MGILGQREIESAIAVLAEVVPPARPGLSDRINPTNRSGISVDGPPQTWPDQQIQVVLFDSSSKDYIETDRLAALPEAMSRALRNDTSFATPTDILVASIAADNRYFAALNHVVELSLAYLEVFHPLRTWCTDYSPADLVLDKVAERSLEGWFLAVIQGSDLVDRNLLARPRELDDSGQSWVLTYLSSRRPKLAELADARQAASDPDGLLSVRSWEALLDGTIDQLAPTFPLDWYPEDHVCREFVAGPAIAIGAGVLSRRDDSSLKTFLQEWFSPTCLRQVILDNSPLANQATQLRDVLKREET